MRRRINTRQPLLPRPGLLYFPARLVAFRGAVSLLEDVVKNILFAHVDSRAGVQIRHSLGLVGQQANDGAIAAGVFSNGDTERYRPLVDSLLHRDIYLLMADFADYVATQAKVDALFADRAAWAERALRNIAGMGPFSSDRTIAEYVDRVWSVKSLN